MDTKENKKNNTTIIIAIIVLVMLLLFGSTLLVLSSMGYISFDADSIKNEDNVNDKLDENEFKEEEKNNKIDGVDEKTNINLELKDAVMFSLKTDQFEYGKKNLVAIDSIGNEINIYDLSEYYGGVHYEYDEKNSVIYLFLYTYEKNNHRDENEKRMLGYIDLTKGNGNYNLEILTEINVERDYFSGMNADYVAKVGDYIYFSNKNLYRYNIKTGQVDDTGIYSSDRTMVVLSYNDKFLLYNIGDKLYLLNINNNSSIIISENGSLGYMYNNKVIYLQEDEKDVSGTGVNYYYSYNVDNGVKKKISGSIGHQSVYFEYIVPFEDKYVSLSDGLFMEDGTKFYSISCDSLGLSLNDYNCKELSVKYLTKFGDNKLLLQVSDMGISGGSSVMNVIFDVNKKSVIELLDVSKDYYVYEQVTYLK